MLSNWTKFINFPSTLLKASQNVIHMNKRLFFLFFFPVFLSCTNMLAQGRFFTQDTIILRLNNCNGNFDICFAGINSGSSPSLGVVVDGVKLNRPYSGCGTDTVALYSVQNMDAAFGPYRLDSLTIGTNKYSNIIMHYTSTIIYCTGNGSRTHNRF